MLTIRYGIRNTADSSVELPSKIFAKDIEMSLRKIEKEQIQDLLQDTETEHQEQDQDDVVVLKVKTRLRAGDDCCSVIEPPGGRAL